MDFVDIAAREYDLGWRFTARLPGAARAAIERVSPLDSFLARFSPERRVSLASFSIATRTLSLEALVGDPYVVAEEATSIAAVCDRVDAHLEREGLRLATEDELEAAAGGALFAWGMELPDGVPYGRETSFVDHRNPNAIGLVLDHDPYRMELCRHALKFGDGGSAICGAEPWPMAWLTLAPSFRQVDEDILDCFPETLENVHVRPVKR